MSGSRGGREGPPAAVVFDFDGVLLDTGAVWEAAYADVLGARDERLTDADRAALLGASVATAAEHLRGRLARPDDAGLEDELAARLAEHLAPRAWRLADAEALLARLRDGPPLGVASNAPGWYVERALGGAGLVDLFAVVLGEEGAARPKPAPDLYLSACELLGDEREDAVAVEDSPAGAAAARAAGLWVVCRPLVPVAGLDADRVVATLEDPTVAADLGLGRG